MLTLVTTLALMASNATGASCAAIENFTNTAAVKTPNGPVVTARYKDRGRLVWQQPRPRFGNRPVVRMAAATLHVGPPGIKVRVACDLPVVR